MFVPFVFRMFARSDPFAAAAIWRCWGSVWARERPAFERPHGTNIPPQCRLHMFHHMFFSVVMSGRYSQRIGARTFRQGAPRTRERTAILIHWPRASFAITGALRHGILRCARIPIDPTGCFAARLPRESFGRLSAAIRLRPQPFFDVGINFGSGNGHQLQ